MIRTGSILRNQVHANLWPAHAWLKSIILVQRSTSKCLSFITSAPSRLISTRDKMERSDIHWSLYPLWTSICTKLFNLLADLVAWIAQNAGVSYLIYYLDDYLTMGPPALHSVPTKCRHTCINMYWIRSTYCNQQTGGPFNISILLRDYFGH